MRARGDWDVNLNVNLHNDNRRRCGGGRTVLRCRNGALRPAPAGAQSRRILNAWRKAGPGLLSGCRGSKMGDMQAYIEASYTRIHPALYSQPGVSNGPELRPPADSASHGVLAPALLLAAGHQYRQPPVARARDRGPRGKGAGTRLPRGVCGHPSHKYAPRGICIQSSHCQHNALPHRT